LGVDIIVSSVAERGGSVSTDLKYAVRALCLRPGFSSAAILTLALGIAANSTVFTIVNGVLLRDLDFDQPDRIVQLGVSYISNTRPTDAGLSYLELREWQAGARTFEGIGGYDELTMNVSDQEHAPQRFSGSYISANAFALIDQPAALGRTLQPEDEREGAPSVVVLGWTVWQGRYRGSLDVIGRTIRVNGVPAAVVGVMPEGFGFPLASEVWRPLAALEADIKNDRAQRVLDGFGRLRESITYEQASADLQGVISSLAISYPDTYRNVEPRIAAFRSGIGGPIVALAAVLIGAVTFVLLIACANVANLLLSRAATRAQEVAVRMSIGASRWRIVRQLLAESLVLAACAGVLGVALSAMAVRIFWLYAVESHPPYWMKFPMDWRVFTYIAAICLGTSIVFGLAPALYTARTNLVDGLTRGLIDGRQGRRWSAVLVVGQLALTLVLLSGAGVMVRNLLVMTTSDVGVDTSSLIRLRLDLPAPAYNTERRLTFYRRLDERLAAMPGLSASITSGVPAAGGFSREVFVEGRPNPAGDSRPTATIVTIGERYFETIGVRQVRGRTFTDDDGETGRGAAIVNERFAAMHFGDKDPIGQRIRLEAPRRPGSTATAAEWMTIVGIVANVQQRPPSAGNFDPVVYIPLAADPAWGVNVLVRSPITPGLVASQVQDQLRAIDPDLPVFDARTLDELLSFQRWPERVFGSMFAIFGLIAMLLATVGLYAVTAYAVARRTREIGLRIALGAEARHVWWVATRAASIQVVIGLAVGLAGSVAVLRTLPVQITHSDGRDSATLAAVTSILVLAALAACLVPARRALTVDPAQTLRQE
jgi:predicted permease